MPELPEVETIVRGLKEIEGKTISKVELFSGAKQIFGTDKLIGKKLESIKRYGKYLLFYFSDNLVMVSHLRMTGQYIIANSKEELDEKFHKHSHVLFSFSNDNYMIFNDQRKFGTIEVISKDELNDYFKSRKLGPDALLELPNFEEFEKLLLKKANSPIKSVLFDQNVLLGLGNIYAQELCFIGKVDPRTLVKDVPKSKLKKIHSAIIPLLEKAIKFNGTTFDGKYVNSKGEAGEFVNFLKVYTQKVCKDCSCDILKIKINGRGTFYCSKCQK